MSERDLAFLKWERGRKGTALKRAVTCEEEADAGEDTEVPEAQAVREEGEDVVEDEGAEECIHAETDKNWVVVGGWVGSGGGGGG